MRAKVNRSNDRGINQITPLKRYTTEVNVPYSGDFRQNGVAELILHMECMQFKLIKFYFETCTLRQNLRVSPWQFYTNLLPCKCLDLA